jgi:prepilin-type N-terminal cleavage/methylation domain-containing protein
MVNGKERQRDEGFTLLEVMIALLVGMVGLMGTMAVQQTVMRATATGNDTTIAMRLAGQRMEEFSVATTAAGPPVVDEMAAMALATGGAGVWSTPEYLDSSGNCATGKAAWTPICRWQRTWQVTNRGLALPYNLSVKVTYNLDGVTPKVVRLDTERRKTF